MALHTHSEGRRTMSLKCGIVGLPNVGKSTLFNALTKAGIAAENYPFCTIEPNVGIVEVPDPRLAALAAIAKPREGDSRRSSSSSTSRDSSPARRRARASATSSSPTSARPTRSRTSCAASRTTTSCTSPARSNPVSDIETINTELALADLAAVEKQLAKVEKPARAGGDKEAQRLVAALEKVRGGARTRAGPRARPTSIAEERACCAVLPADDEADDVRRQRRRARLRRQSAARRGRGARGEGRRAGRRRLRGARGARSPISTATTSRVPRRPRA